MCVGSGPPEMILPFFEFFLPLNCQNGGMCQTIEGQKYTGPKNLNVRSGN